MRGLRGLAAAAAALGLLTIGASANANGLNNLLAGVTGLVTFPVDPLASCVAPPEAFEDAFGAPVTPHVLGFFEGSVLMVYRATMGALDIALAPFWIFPTLSPESRYVVFPFYEIEYE